MPPQILFGTATFGMDGTSLQSPSSITPLLTLLQDRGVAYLDTAARYPPRAPTRAETLIGEAAPLSHRFTLDTKVLASPPGNGSLTRAAIDKSVADSLERLGVSSVNVLYAHMPDPETAVLEQVRGFNDQIEKGRCNEWGVSNHSVEQVRRMLGVCEREGLRKPSVYQGDYNVVTRGMERELLGLLREHGMRFVAFRPLAAGFLTGGVTSGSVKGTRFDPATNPIGGAMSSLFDTPELNGGMRRLQEAVKREGLTTLEMALRWVFYHSALGDRDGVILGASKVSQVEENLEAIRKGRLSQEVVAACEYVWKGLESTRGSVL